jgi:chromosome segregation ATPase
MKPKALNIGVVLILLLSFGAAVFFYFETTKLSKTVQTLEHDIDRAEKVGVLLKRKYAEEKAGAAAMHRQALYAEGQKRQAEQKVEALTAELKNYETNKKLELKKWEDKLSQATAEIDRLKEANEKWRETYNERTELLKQTIAKLKDKEAVVERQGEKIAGLESDLERENRRNERYLGHNKKMAAISKSILAKYDDKGVFTSLKQVEPFTQLKQVELEKIIQEYLDGLDGAVIRETDE